MRTETSNGSGRPRAPWSTDQAHVGKHLIQLEGEWLDWQAELD